MAKKKIIYCFDVDGTICNDTFGKYKKAIPFPDRIKKVNKLYDEGHTIIYLTARGNTTGINWTKLTKKQFKEWGVKYHKLLFQKIHAHVFVDNLGVNADVFFSK